jgi:hypothetical protein
MFLLEVMISVAIFAIAVLTLARCIGSCMDAQRISREEAWIRQLLSNRMSEISAARVVPDAQREQRLPAPFGEVTLLEEVRLKDVANDENARLPGLYEVELHAQWKSSDQKLSRDLSFLILRLGR